jgi:hypothetical protein
MKAVFGILALLGAAAGVGALCWYHNLTDEQREEADGLLREYAMRIYDRTMDQLAQQEQSVIFDLVKPYFG